MPDSASLDNAAAILSDLGLRVREQITGAATLWVAALTKAIGPQLTEAFLVKALADLRPAAPSPSSPPAPLDELPVDLGRGFGERT